MNTIADIPAEYITDEDRAKWQEQETATHGETYAYCHATNWVIWNSLLHPYQEQRVILDRIPGAVCSCCHFDVADCLFHIPCGCGAWRDVQGKCILHSRLEVPA